MGSNDTLCWTEFQALACRARGDLRVEPQPKHGIANCSQTVSPVLPPSECEELNGLATTIPSFAKLFWFLLLLVLLIRFIRREFVRVANANGTHRFK